MSRPSTPQEFRGTVTKYATTNDGNRYSIVEIQNRLNLNSRLFIPGLPLALGKNVHVTVTEE
jgi:hypothetical protein